MQDLTPLFARAMGDGGYRHLPVLDADGKVLGIVSRSDFKALEPDRCADEVSLWEGICRESCAVPYPSSPIVRPASTR